VLKIKGLIRWSEAKAGGDRWRLPRRASALSRPAVLPHGHDRQEPGRRPEDVRIIRELDRADRPAQIYVAGDLSDPHGTHRVCAEAIFRALGEIEEEQRPIPEVLLYRGAWQEWALHEIEIAVPLSPGDLARSGKAIFMHESRRTPRCSPAATPANSGNGPRTATAAPPHVQPVRLPEYFAMEAFVRVGRRADLGPMQVAAQLLETSVERLSEQQHVVAK
jgi:glucosamine-6-phosphate deaminase